MLNGETCRDGVSALHEEDNLGVIGHEFFNPRIISTPKNSREFLVDLFDYRHRFFHGTSPLQLQRRSLLRHDLRSMRYGMPRIERIGMLVGRQKFFYLA